MKSFTKFLRTTITGGILFLIPVVIILSVAKKALVILHPITEPWDKMLTSDIIWGLDGHNLVGFSILLIICFLAGLIFRLSVVQSSVSKIERNFLLYIPGYSYLKSHLRATTFHNQPPQPASTTQAVPA